MFENYFYSKNPPEFNRDAWYGLMFRWYGVDKVGNIAIFESGELPIPRKVFTNETEYRETDIFFRQLPKITSAKLTDKVKNRKTASGKQIDYQDCLSEAERGLFFIDEIDTIIGSEYLYGYYLVATPEITICFNTLPEKIQNFLESYRLPVIFTDIKSIDINANQ